MSTETGKWPQLADRREVRDRRAAALGWVVMPTSIGASYVWLGWRGGLMAFVVAVIALTYSLMDYSHRRRREQRERHLASQTATYRARYPMGPSGLSMVGRAVSDPDDV